MEDEQKQPGVCGAPCEVYSRVVGYIRPVQQWNRGKRSEYRQRRVFAAPRWTTRSSWRRLTRRW